jgi:hypothetical protein
MARATGTFQITSMHEDTYQELNGEGKLTRAGGTQQFRGDIQGDGLVEWLMCYPGDGGARYVGLQRIDGSLGGKKGSFVIESVGNFDGKRSKGDWTVIAGSGDGDLAGISGTGSFEAPSGPEATYTLDYELG